MTMFGYQFSSGPQEPESFHFNGSSAPASGPPLLSQQEHSRIDDFFGQTAFWSDDGNDKAISGKNEASLNFGFYETNIPHQVYEVAMQSPYDLTRAMPFSFSQPTMQQPMPSMGPPHPATIRNSSSDFHGSAEPQLSLHHSPATVQVDVPPIGSTVHPVPHSQGRDASNGVQRAASNSIISSQTGSLLPVFTESGYGLSVQPQGQPHDTLGKPWTAVVQFGTDDRFSPGGFNGPEAKEMRSDYDRQITETMKYFQHTDNGSRPGSPSSKRVPHLPILLDQGSDPNGDPNLIGTSASKDSERGGKRPKVEPSNSSVQAERNSVDDSMKRKGKGATGSPPRKKKSTHTAARQNLSDEQKRNNHIKSEQKRRDTIKQSFLDLHDLVPALQQTTFSKADQLRETVEWLQKLLAGNDELKGKLRDRGISPTAEGIS